jgi:AcrR family transcriptional regulator
MHSFKTAGATMIDEEKLCLETFALYQEDGVKFRMGDLAARLGISKKTLYEHVYSKEELILRTTEHYFDAVVKEQASIHADATIAPLQKAEKLLCVVPHLPFQHYRVRELRRMFPEAYQRMTQWLHTGREQTFLVLDEAIAQGLVEPFDQALFSKMYAYAIEGLVNEREQYNKEDFSREQHRMVNMLLRGISTQRGRESLSGGDPA